MNVFCNFYKPPFKRAVILLALLTLCSGMGNDFSAEAAKKKAAGADPAVQAEADLKKNLDPINDRLTKLMVKIQSRSLLSPDEAGQLVDLKFKLMDIMNQYPQNVLIARPVYQAGVLFSEREEYNDAYELFNYLAQGFPTNPYGAKAKGQVQQLEKRFGASYFSVEAAAPSPASTTASPAAAAPTAPPAAAAKK
jgi:hypothetical protein